MIQMGMINMNIFLYRAIQCTQYKYEDVFFEYDIY